MTETKATSGFTLIEVLISVGIVAILGLITAQVIKDVSHYTQNHQLTTIRDQIAIWARSNAANLPALRNSYKQAGNTAWYQCICGGACTSGQVGLVNGVAQGTAVSLFQAPPIPTPVPPPAPVPLPLYYDAGGIPCDNNPSANNCLIQVIYSFIAQCLPVGMPTTYPYPPYTCSNGAEFFGIMFTVQQNPPTVATQGALLRPVSGIVFTEVATFAPAGQGYCP